MSDITMTPSGLALLGGRLCLDFCNTIERRPVPHDFLASKQYLGFVHWCEDTGLIGQDVAAVYRIWETTNPDAAQTLFEKAIALREAIYEIGCSVIEGQAVPAEALTLLNQWAHDAMVARHVRAVDGAFTWAWTDGTVPEHPLWQIALSAVEVLIDEDHTRLRQCPGCGWLFYDQSKNNSRTWCDMRFCGNRAKNKRFHTRHKSL